MASSHRMPETYYRTVSSSIMSGFDWEDDVTIRPKAQQQQGATTPTAAFRYLPMNPAILGGFDDELSSTPWATSSGTSRATPTTAPERGYLPTSSSIFDGFDEDPEEDIYSAPPQKRQKGKEKATPPPLGSNNPFLGAAQKALVAARTQVQTDETTTITTTAVAEPQGHSVDHAVDVGFGQRYKVEATTETVVITNRRQVRCLLSDAQECVVCAESKEPVQFPLAAVTKACTHPPQTCLECIAMSIKTDLNSKLWKEINCPECGEHLQYDDVQKFSDDETKKRYQDLAFRSAVSEADNFLWCASGCGYGQVHDGGMDQPIVICRLCDHRSCFHHKVVWHENLTCEEYDLLQADPVNFRSRFELENIAAEEAARIRRAQEDADRVFAQSLVAEEQHEIDRERMEQAEKERKEKEAREKKAKAAREKQEMEKRMAAARRKKEEDLAVKTIGMTTKPCPGCESPIEKNAGCAHMTCFRCRYEFCWGCNEKWASSHRTNCTGGR